jgi:hypothetical protein
MYEGIKKAIGTTVKKCAPLKSLDGEIINDKRKQKDRWVEHYLELNSRETKLIDTALNAMEAMPTLDHLDTFPTMAEVNCAIDLASGRDGIPTEVIRSTKDILTPQIHQLTMLCWHKRQVPLDFKDSHIVTLYKNNGDPSNCNNYRGISLLCIVGKILARIVLHRLQVLGDQVYPESQCGFRGTGQLQI